MLIAPGEDNGAVSKVARPKRPAPAINRLDRTIFRVCKFNVRTGLIPKARL